MAALGDRKNALSEGKKAIEQLPISKDAAYGVPYEESMIWIYTFFSDKDAAIAQIERLFNLASWISVGWLKMNPLNERLAHHPRYQELLEKYRLK